MRIVKIQSLPSAKKWIDRDEIMLHSCFQLLKDCVEKEKVHKKCNYKLHKTFVDEVNLLYKWWNKRAKLGWANNKHVEDDAMLLRLIKIRTALWT